MKGSSSAGQSSYIGVFILWSCVFSAAIIMLGYIVSKPVSEVQTSGDGVDSGYVVVIDPGHGGEDGGASAPDGTVEKDLNLAVAKRVAMLCRLLGLDTVMTREDDTLLYAKYDEGQNYNGRKKAYDLRNRVRFTKEQGDSVFVSIHMNKFPDVRCSGAQVYYSPNSAESMSLAEILQQNIKEHLAPDNDRKIKKAGSSIFLLERLETPAVLVECGFMSNPQDLQKLCDSSYQTDFSLVTACTLAEFEKNR